MDLAGSNLRQKVDALMDRFYGAGVASHPTIIEQINYLLFMRALSARDEELKDLGITDKNKIVFDGELEKYKWENLLSLNAEALFEAIQECFNQIPASTTNSTVRLVFRNAHLKLYDKPTLRIVVHELDKFSHEMDELNHEGKRDIYGDMYEYLLSKLSQAGTSGQFRTPRHIIEFLVAVIAPNKGETILDPAVGTAGFLVKAFEYLKKQYTSAETAATGGSFDLLSSKEHTVLYEHTFNGFDSDEDMIKFGMMNLYLHGLENAHLLRQNTLTDTAGNRDKYDIILANPPFSGRIDRDSVAQELQMNSGATEVLFLRYMLEHLGKEGRGGVIVPEGVLFNTSGAHTKIRQLLLENGLWCVVSLPAGVFNPYAGVKTSIVFFDKTRISKKEVLFAKVEHDGFSIGANRRSIAQNDLPEILQDIQRYQHGEELQLPNAHAVTHERIGESKDHNLSGDRYKITTAHSNQQWPMVELGNESYFKIESGGTPSSKNPNFWNGNINWATLVDLPATELVTKLSSTQRKITEAGLKESSAKLLPTKTILISSRATIGRIAITETPTATNQGFKNIVIKSNKIIPEYIAYIIVGLRDDLKSLATGGTFAEFSKTAMSNLSIPLPPIEIQKEIVDELDSYQKIIDAARTIVQTYKPVIKINLSWPESKLGDHVDVFSGYAFKSNLFNNTGEGISIIRIRDVKPNKTKTYYSGEYDEKFLVHNGDLLIGMDGEFNPVIWGGGDALLNQRVCKIENFRDLLPRLTIEILRDELKNIEASTYAVTVKHISAKQIKDIKIKVPSAGEQKEIVKSLEIEQEIIDANKNLIKIYEKKIYEKIAQTWGE